MHKVLKFLAVPAFILLAFVGAGLISTVLRYESIARDYYGRRCAELLPPSDDLDVQKRICIAAALDRDPLASFLIGFREGYQSAYAARKSSP